MMPRVEPIKKDSIAIGNFKARVLTIVMTVTFSLFSLSALPVQAANIVLEWNRSFLDAIEQNRSSDVETARAAAILHTSIFDAVNGIDVQDSQFKKGYKAYSVNPQLAPQNASKEASALAAGYRVLCNLYPQQQAIFDTKYTQALNSLKGEQEQIRWGLQWGEKVAQSILTLRTGDGSDGSDPYTPSGEIGKFSGTWNQQYRNVTPFVMPSPDRFRANPPYALTDKAYVREFNEVKKIGRLDSVNRTSDQTEIGFFWESPAGTVTPPGQWLSIAQIYAEQEKLDLSKSARLFALLGLGLGDAGIVATDTKAAYSSWRPRDAIQLADRDGNPFTKADPNWLPLNGGQGSSPEHVSGHSVFAGLGSTILSNFHGKDDYDFTLTLEIRDGTKVTRSYSSFLQAAEEAGKSRVYLGIHFEKGNQDGLRTGRELGELVLNTQLQPIDDK